LLGLIAVEGDHVLQHEASRKPDLEPICEQPRQRPRDAETLLDRKCQAQGRTEAANAFGCSMVARNAVAARTVP
jgi:hypothetical protein